MMTMISRIKRLKEIEEMEMLHASESWRCCLSLKIV